MRYNITLLGNKKMTKEMADYIQNKLGKKIDLIITVDEGVTNKNHIADFSNMESIGAKYGIEIFYADAYSLKSEKCRAFFEGNQFNSGISMGWQRIVPKYILDRFNCGIYGFHGSCAYLPFGRGRSPMNWSILKGDTRFILNMFKYDELPDSPNIYKKEMFEISPFDNIETMQLKYFMSAKKMVNQFFCDFESDSINITNGSKDFDLWYGKRTPEDGKIDFHDRTREIYNLIRSVSKPFPGAFGFIGGKKITIWQAVPFDSIMDFSDYAPGEIVDILNGNLIVRTVDGSLIIKEYEYGYDIYSNMIIK